jgi:hypothetical protein
MHEEYYGLATGLSADSIRYLQGRSHADAFDLLQCAVANAKVRSRRGDIGTGKTTLWRDSQTARSEKTLRARAEPVLSEEDLLRLVLGLRRVSRE